jgi:hypothetical protein
MIVCFLKSCWLLWALHLTTSFSNGDYDLQMQFYVLIVWFPKQNMFGFLLLEIWSRSKKVVFIKIQLIALKSNNVDAKPKWEQS